MFLLFFFRVFCVPWPWGIFVIFRILLYATVCKSFCKFIFNRENLQKTPLSFCQISTGQGRQTSFRHCRLTFLTPLAASQSVCPPCPFVFHSKSNSPPRLYAAKSAGCAPLTPLLHWNYSVPKAIKIPCRVMSVRDWVACYCSCGPCVVSRSMMRCGTMRFRFSVSLARARSAARAPSSRG